MQWGITLLIDGLETYSDKSCVVSLVDLLRGRTKETTGEGGWTVSMFVETEGGGSWDSSELEIIRSSLGHG